MRETEKITPRPHPIKPFGGPFRRWHLTPWKRTEATALLDDIDGLGDDDGTSGLDVLNNLITQAGNVYSQRQNPYGYPMSIPNPRPGQMVPVSKPMLGMDTQTLLLAGAGILAAVFFLRKK